MKKRIPVNPGVKTPVVKKPTAKERVAERQKANEHKFRSKIEETREYHERREANKSIFGNANPKDMTTGPGRGTSIKEANKRKASRLEKASLRSGGVSEYEKENKKSARQSKNPIKWWIGNKPVSWKSPNIWGGK
jgi:hypothetical protein